MYRCVDATTGTNLCPLGNLDTDTGEFVISTTDKEAYPPGEYPVEIEGYISGFPGQLNSHTFTYTFVDLCETATVSVILIDNNDPENHTYLSSTSFTASYTPSEASCSIVYSCEPPEVDSGTEDLCSLGTLDEETGVFTLTTTDKVTYPPGKYTVEIKGSIENYASQFESHTFTYQFVDLCSSASVTVV